MKLIFAFGLCFQLPVLLTLLVRVGILQRESAGRKRRYAIVGVFIMAAILTPPDAISPGQRSRCRSCCSTKLRSSPRAWSSARASASARRPRSGGDFQGPAAPERRRAAPRAVDAASG
jgi:hypothetical protein